MNKAQIFAWISILIIPITYIVSIILSVMNHPLAEPILAITLLSTVVGPMTIYTFTVFPKHLAEIGNKIAEFHDEHNS